MHPRKLGTNTSIDIKQNCTFIGATNRPIDEMIFDRTGMRRFYQINCLEKMNWSAINQIDYLSLIQCIDENREDGYLFGAILDQVRAEQEKIVSHDDIHHFLSDSGYAPSPISQGHFTPNQDLYSQYESWIIKNGAAFKHSKHDLLKRLKNRGFVEGSKNIHGKTHRGLWVTAPSTTPVATVAAHQTLMLVGAQ
jgi:hypothetical protein